MKGHRCETRVRLTEGNFEEQGLNPSATGDINSKCFWKLTVPRAKLKNPK